jgi:hypothetical protein
MQYQYTNLLINPSFDFWDLGESFNATGYTADRWKLIRLNYPPVDVIISKTILDNSTNTPQWYRGKSAMKIAVSDLGAADATINVRQYIENGAKLTGQYLTMKIIAFGPSGGNFEYGFNGEYRSCETFGNNPKTGVPIPSYAEFSYMVNSVTAEYMSCDIFQSPSVTGDYTIGLAQLQFMKPGVISPSWEFRSPQIERTLLDRYIHVINAGVQGEGNSNGFFAGVRFPTTMRITPTWKTLKTSIDIVQNTTGDVVTDADCVSSATNITQNGARLVIGNFSGLASTRYTLTTDEIGYFIADY